MLTVTESAILAYPPAEAFDLAADPHKQLEWDRGNLRSVEKLTPGPLGAGARYRGEFKGFGTMAYEFSEFEQGRRFTHYVKMPIGELRHIFTFEPDGGGTRFTQEGKLKPSLIGRVMWPVMSRTLRKRFHTISSEVEEYLGR
jgi:polyketide cyclase/dehydrase/lipid transport protein